MLDLIIGQLSRASASLFPAKFVLTLSLVVFSFQNSTAEATQPEVNLSALCFEHLHTFPGSMNEKELKKACEKVALRDQCMSVEKVPIYHYDRTGDAKTPKKILVFSLIHGDETGAGTVGRYWMERLESISPRNTWRVVPVLNPDGVKLKTRTNANKVDLNRNFPTKDWDDLAQKYWKIQSSANPRRFPGDQAGSEPETKCALGHIADFSPDFIISIHTPLNVLDFDGPRVQAPKTTYLPWKSLGHFPGSLGRYMWFERKTPVLTMELKPELPKTIKPFEELQDLIGTLVLYDMK